MNNEGKILAERFFDVIEGDIVPLTQDGVRRGNKIFGAAILLKSDLSLVIAGTNLEMENPLWHGEVATLKAFYEIPSSSRPATADCFFLSTHEPCSLCLSSITWAGFDNFYYLFGYEDTRNTFNIPHDLKILKEVFNLDNGNYNRENSFWTSVDLINLVRRVCCTETERVALLSQLERIKLTYNQLSDVYQTSKVSNTIPLN